MKSTNGMRLVLTNLACKQAVKKGMDADSINDVFNTPAKIYPNKDRAGQYVISKGGVSIIGEPQGDKFVGVMMRGHK